jgi:bacillopeptidase F (M6 metalloprotease family)
MGGSGMITRKANQKHSYLIMKLDYMLDQFDDYGVVDSYDLRDYLKIFRQLPREKQQQYDWMLDHATELYDSHDQPEH